MQTVILNTGSPCNNDCLMCASAPVRTVFRGKLLPPRYLQKLQVNLSAGKRLGSTRVIITGGEPTLNPYLFEAVRYAKSVGFKEIILRTNGRLFCYREQAVSAVGAGVNAFEVSLHGHQAHLHEYLTRAPGSFLQTLGGIKNLVGLGQTVICTTVICRPNFRHLPDIARLALEAGVSGLRFCVVELPVEEREAKTSLVVRQEMAAPWLIKALDLTVKAGKTASVDGIPACLLGRHSARAAARTPREDFSVDPAFPAPPYPCAWSERTDVPLGPECGRCSQAISCAGPPSAYTERFGWNEFAPMGVAHD